MPKKLRANAFPPTSQGIDFSDEKTKPNIRLVQAMSGRPQFTKKKIEVAVPAEAAPSPGIARWIPYAFGVLMAFGFVHLQSGKPARSKTLGKVAAIKEFQSQNAYVSPLMETVRSASAKP